MATIYQLGYLSEDADFPEQDEMYLQAMELAGGKEPGREFFRGAIDGQLDKKLNDGLICVGSWPRDKYIPAEQALWVL